MLDCSCRCWCCVSERCSMASRAFARFLRTDLLFTVVVTDKEIFCNEFIRTFAADNYGLRAVYAAKSLSSWA